ncbi:hypothetical protein TWF281_003181 [Arthrobotrys megalospora]
MARCKSLSPAMLVVHFLLVLLFSSLVISLPAGGPIKKGKDQVEGPKKGKSPIDQFNDVVRGFHKIGNPTKPHPRAAGPPPPFHTRIPGPIDPPSGAPLSGKAVDSTLKEHARDLLANCTKRGIDILGDIPSDAKQVPAGHPDFPLKPRNGMVFENMTFVYTFEADSDASLWASAQVLTSQFPELVNGTEAYQKVLKKRQAIRADPGVGVEVRGPAGALAQQGKKIGIGMWEGGRLDWTTNPQPCQGKGWWIETVQHDTMYLATIPTWSVGVSYRALGGYDYERLEFRTHAGSGKDTNCQDILYSAGQRTPASCWRHGSKAAKCFILLQNPTWKAPNQTCQNGVCTKASKGGSK